MTPHRPGFTGCTIARADHLRLDPARIAALAARPDARLLSLSGIDPVLDEQGRLAWVALGDSEAIFLGLDGEMPLFAPLPQVETGQRAWAVFQTLSMMAPEDAALWGTARSLIEWHNRHNFCANCGATTSAFRAGWGRKCASCAAEHFPRVDPVVIMLAQHEGRVLLGRQRQYPQGRYSALAGFVEPGESLEEAVARELFEEAGIKVGNVRYVASQPWPFPGSLMIACIADAASDALALDTDELESALWVDEAGVRAALAGDASALFAPPPPIAIAHTLLLHWLAAGDRPALRSAIKSTAPRGRRILEAYNGMDDRTNTIAGWALGAMIVALGATIVTGEMFTPERPEKMGYPIEGVVLEGEDGAEAEQPIAAYLAAADAGAGEQVFKKCAACHNVNQGGANGIGPNLFGVMGKPVAGSAGFAFSDALKSKGGSWDWDNMSAWLKSPRAYAAGTKMTFAGLSKPEDRANVLVYLNAQGSNLPLPAPPAASPAENAAEVADAPVDGKAENEPVISEGDAAKQPAGNVKGEGAPETSGRAEQTKAR